MGGKQQQEQQREFLPAHLKQEREKQRKVYSLPSKQQRQQQDRQRQRRLPSKSPTSISSRRGSKMILSPSEEEDYGDYEVVARECFAVLSEDGAETSLPIEQTITWQHTRSGLDSIYDKSTIVEPPPQQSQKVFSPYESQYTEGIEAPYEKHSQGIESPIDWNVSNETQETDERPTSSDSDDSVGNKGAKAKKIARMDKMLEVTNPCRLRYSLLICAIFVILIGGALAIIFVSGALDIGDVVPALSEEAGPAPSPRITFPPTPVPTVDIQTAQAQAVLAIILEQDVVDKTVFDDPSSPQSKALSWISTKQDVEQATDEEILSMFAILSLYYATGGGQTWLSNFPQASNDACQWWFVECIEGEVTEIRLDSAGLHGYLPFLEMTFLAETLTVLDVSNNDLTGTISTEIGAFTNLKELHVSQNPSLSGSLPTEMGKLIKLESLDLFEVDGLSGELPSHIGNMESLKSLSLIGVNMVGTIPTDLGRLANLQKLDIQSSKFVGQLPLELGASMSSLEILHITQTPLTGTLPTQLWSIPLLSSLVLEGLTGMTAELDFYVGVATNLVDLRLSLPKLEGELPPELGLLSNLVVLSITSKELQGDIPTELGDLIKLESFALTNASEVTGPLPVELSKLSELRTLIVVNTGVSGPFPSVFGQDLSNLEFAVFRGNAMSGTFPVSISQLPDLHTVNFGENEVSGSVPESICSAVPEGGIIVDCQEVSCGCCVCQETLSTERNV